MKGFLPVSERVIRSASITEMKVIGVGNVDKLFFTIIGKITLVHLTDVFLVPSWSENIFSLSA